MRVKLGILGMILLAAFCGFEIYHQTGIVHSTRKNGYGCICHNFDPAPSVSVWISGPDSVRAGMEAIYEVSVSKSGSIAAGFNVAAYYGSLGIVDSVGTKLETESSTDSLELTHTLPRFVNGSDTITWLFKYRAPLTIGWVDTIYSAGNSVNNDTTPDGDAWNFGNEFLVHVLQPNSVSDQSTVRTYKLAQNYPNPFNPLTTIRYDIQLDARVKLTVFDLAGREVRVLVDKEQTAGTYDVLFDTEATSGLSTGIYLYRLSATSRSAETFVAVKKMILLK